MKAVILILHILGNILVIVGGLTNDLYTMMFGILTECNALFVRFNE